jgi:hypothetical protein
MAKGRIAAEGVLHRQLDTARFVTMAMAMAASYVS